MQAIRIILADDHSLMCEGTRRILEQYPGLEVVGMVGDGEGALALADSLRPDVAVIDIRMPKLNGIEVVKRMPEHSPGTKTLVLTAHDDDDYVFALMEAGASGYLLKTASPKDLADAVRRVHRGETALDPAITAKMTRLWSRRATHATSPSPQSLTARELEVLQLAAEGLHNKDIAERLGISVRTVEGHFNGIFAKLVVSSRVEAVLYAITERIITLEVKTER